MLEKIRKLLSRSRKSLALAIWIAVLLAMPASFAYADSWKYYTNITIQDTSGAARTGVPVLLDISGNTLVSAGRINSDGRNTRINEGTSERDFGIYGDRVGLLVPSLSANQQRTYRFYTGYSPDIADHGIITGSGGYVTVADDAALEPGASFEFEIKGWISTTVGIAKNLMFKPFAFLLDISSANTIRAAVLNATFLKLGDPATLPVGNALGAAFSADGVYLAVAHTTTPYITIYKRSGDTFTKLDNPVTLPTGIGKGVAFTSDGTYLAVAHTTTPFVTIYKRSGDTFTKLTNPVTLPTGNSTGAAFTSDGTYLAISHATTPFITIYKRSADTFTKLDNPATLPTGTGYSTAFTSDGTYLAVGHLTTPWITIYKRDGDTFTKLTNPATLPAGGAGGVNGVAFTTDGTYLAVTIDYSIYVYIYKRSGNTFTKLADPATLPTGSSYGVAFASDSSSLAVGWSAAPYVNIYTRSGDVFTKLSNSATTPTGTGRGAAFYLDGTSSGTYLAVAHDTTPFVTIYNALNINKQVTTTEVLSGDHKVKVTYDGANLKIFVADPPDYNFVEKATGVGASVPDTTPDWQVLGGSAIPYADYYKHKVGANPIVHYPQPTTIITGTLVDTEGAAQNGTIVWGTNSNITVTMGSETGFESTIASIATSTAPADTMLPFSEPTDWYATGSNIVNLPMYSTFNTAASEIGMTTQTLYVMVLLGLASAVGLGVLLFTGSTVISIIGASAIIGIGWKTTILSGWMLFLFVILAIGILFLAKKT